VDRPTTAERTTSARGVAWATASACAFSLSAVVGKDLLGALGVASLLFWRFLLASAVLWAILAVRRHRGGPDPFAAPWPLLVSLGGLFGVMVLVGFAALDRLDASVYIVIFYVYPALVVLGSMALGHRLDRVTALALALVTTGVVLTVPEALTGSGEFGLTGVLLALAQAVLFAAYMVLHGHFVPPGVDSLVIATWNTVGAGLVVTPFAFVGGLITPQSSSLVLEVILFALIPTVAATTFLLHAMGSIVPRVAAMIMTLEVVLAIVWSVLFLGEEVGWIEWLGALVVVAGVVLAQRPGLSDPEPPDEPVRPHAA
jgi:drug/metabolite transporter (DMT)-like permease